MHVLYTICYTSGMDPYDFCPTCGVKFSGQCRCFRSDRFCPNGHHWHRCPVHKTTVVGESDHSKPDTHCTCGNSGLGDQDKSLLATLRSVRVGPFAVFDFVVSIYGMRLLGPYFGMKPTQAMWLALPIGIAVHKVLGLDTPLNQMVLGEPPNRLAQAAVIVALYKGLQPQ